MLWGFSLEERFPNPGLCLCRCIVSGVDSTPSRFAIHVVFVIPHLVSVGETGRRDNHVVSL